MSGDQFDFHQGNKETLTGTLHDPAATTGHVLTVQADKSIAARPGGGSTPIQVVTVPISSAQLLALDAAQVSLVEGVAGKIIWPLDLVAAYIAGATPYTDHGVAIYLGWGDVSAGQPMGGPPLSMVGAGFWDQTDDQVQGQGYSLINPGLIAPSADLDGADLYFGLAGPGAPTDGDGTLLITITYRLAPLS